jgi:hypothetical protein
MITVVAEKENGSQSFDNISITKDGVTILLNQEDCKMLFETLQGKRGIVHEYESESSYQANKLYLFSCEKPISLSSYPKTKND